MSDLNLKVIEDARIHNIESEATFAVESSAAQSTYQPFTASNASNNSVTFNVAVPSENIAMDRGVKVEADMNFSVKIVANGSVANHNAAGYLQAFSIGLYDGVCAYPFNSSISQLQATINNASVSTSLADIMPVLNRMTPQHTHSDDNEETTAFVDQGLSDLGEYRNQNASPLYANPSDLSNKVKPRGGLPYEITYTKFRDVAPAVVGTQATVAAVQNLIYEDALDSWMVCIKFRTCEPLMYLTPFAHLDSGNKAAFLGLQSLNIVANLQSDYDKYLFKSSNVGTAAAGFTHTVSAGDLVGNAPGAAPVGTTANLFRSDPRLRVNFLSLQPEQYAKLSTKNVLPMLDYPRYISSYGGTIADTLATATPFTKTATSVPSPVIQLSQVPDLIIVVLKQARAEQSVGRQLSLATLTGCNVTFNNASGLLASASPEQLYEISRRNGSCQNWAEFSGMTTSQTAAKLAAANLNSNVASLVGTQGSILVLNPTYDFSLPSYLSGGSLGQFGFQITAQYANLLGVDLVNPDLEIIVVNSGVMYTQQGSSTVFSGMLTKQAVLDAKNKGPDVDSEDLRGMRGGAIVDKAKAEAGRVIAKYVKRKMASGAGIPSISSLGGSVEGARGLRKFAK